LSESVADQSRQLEQLSHDLDSSLTRLFATQLETLDNLRQRLDEQERLWLEQQAVRRAGA
jgi:regulator of replication initiation timing